jgi:hypothetical protein
LLQSGAASAVEENAAMQAAATINELNLLFTDFSDSLCKIQMCP